jgi:phospholipase/carboxylesterase
MGGIIRNARGVLKPVDLLVLPLLISLACGDTERAMVDPAAAPTWVERRAEPRAPTPTPPLLVLLHGIGADENDLFPLAGRADPRFRTVSLRAPHAYAIGWAWFEIDFLPGARVRPHVDQALRSLDALASWVAAAPARLETDPARTYLLGFSQGAMMALGLLQSHPELLAGAVALSGRAPEGLFPVTAPREAVARVPLFVAHGLHDDLLPVDNGRRTRAAFADRSVDLTYREYPIGHGVSDEEMDDVAAWLTARLDAPSPAGAAGD